MGLSRRNVFLCDDDYKWFEEHAKTLNERKAAFVIREAMSDYRKKHEKKTKPKTQVKKVENAIGYLDCTNGKYPVTQDDIDKWSTAYPAVDVGSELNKIQAWLHSNEKRRKTVNGCARFINSWLSKTQNQGGSNGLQTGSSAIHQQSSGARQLEQSAAALEQWERNHQGQEQAGVAVGEWQGAIQHKMD